MEKPKPCITPWWNTPVIWKQSKNVENTRLRLVFCTFPSCSQMTIVEDHRLPKIVMFGELSTGHRERGAPKKWFKDSLKKSLTACNIYHRQWSDLAVDRVACATQSTKLLPSLKWTGKIHSKTRDRGGRPAPPPPPHQTFLFPAVTAHGPVSLASVWSAISAPAIGVNVDKLLKSSFAMPSQAMMNTRLRFFIC